MAILDTEYVKAPSLRAGDLSITKSSTGFRMFEGDMVFLTGSADGTLTIGKENLTSSIPTLHINAAEVYWNNKPLKDYWEEGAVPDLTQDVTRLQELTTSNTQAIQNTDKRLSQEIADLRMDALGAEINTLVSPINGFVSDIRGVAIPATILKESLPYFNRITINNVQSTGTGYLAIYSCDATTPAVSSPCTLLYVVEGVFETTGSQTAPASSTIEIPEKITVPDDGLIILIFANSTTAPQTDNISWVATENSTMSMRLGIYSPGGTNRPYDTNGEYVLQKVANTFFITYSPDIDFSYVYEDDVLSADIEEIKSQIGDLRSDLEDYMTYEETFNAISYYPGPTEGYEYMLGTLVDRLSNVNMGFNLTKRSPGYELDGQSTRVGIEYSGINVLLSGSINGSSAIQNIAGLELTASKGFQVSYCYSSSLSTSTMAQLVLESGHLELGLKKDVNVGGFELIADTPTSDNHNTGMYMTYYSPRDTSYSTHLFMNGDTTTLEASGPGGYAGMEVHVSGIRLLQFMGSTGNTWTLEFNKEGLGMSTDGLDWDRMINQYSSFIPTISVVYAMIQSALANP